MSNIQICTQVSAKHMYEWRVWWQAMQVSDMYVSCTSKER